MIFWKVKLKIFLVNAFVLQIVGGHGIEPYKAISKVIDHVILCHPELDSGLFQDPNALHVRSRSRYSQGGGDWPIEYFNF
jgi:hypothetical protein